MKKRKINFDIRRAGIWALSTYTAVTLPIVSGVAPAYASTGADTTAASARKGRATNRRIDEIIVHCTATPEGRDVDVAEIDRWHRQRGFSGIGYHYLIGRDGRIMAGRPEHLPGAHCKGHNARSIGVCYVGGMDASGKHPKDTRTETQRRALLDLLARLMERYPGATIHGHREFAAKACPCFDAAAEYSHLVKSSNHLPQ